MPDYRTGERAFQLLAQVAGRAGRGLLGGRVILQTYQPQHYAIQAAADHDFISFYLDEIRFRTQHGLPPFRRLAKLVYVDPVAARAEQEAKKLAQALRWHIHEKQLSATELLGPQPPFFARIDRRLPLADHSAIAGPTPALKRFPDPAPLDRRHRSGQHALVLCQLACWRLLRPGLSIRPLNLSIRPVPRPCRSIFLHRSPPDRAANDVR